MSEAIVFYLNNTQLLYFQKKLKTFVVQYIVITIVIYFGQPTQLNKYLNYPDD